MYERIEKCPICENPTFENVRICIDQQVTEESFVITECNSCGFQLTNPRPDSNSISKYYQSEDYVSHTNRSTSLTNFLFKAVRLYTVGTKRRLLERYSAVGSVLDVGCGTGSFLSACQKAGWKIQGTEPDSGARSIAEKSLGVPLHGNVIELEQKFDVITLWHVLEHVHDLQGLMKKLTQLLNQKGTIIVAVPNRESHDAAYYGENWAAWDVPRHLYHFRPADIRKLAKKFKLKVIDTLPMKFDAFYVSLLSERYIHGKNRYYRAFRSGLKSNKKAKSDHNYSSLIYVLQA